METYFVSYRFKSLGQWALSFFYTDANSLDKARDAAEKILAAAITAQWEIISVRKVGE